MSLISKLHPLQAFPSSARISSHLHHNTQTNCRPPQPNLIMPSTMYGMELPYFALFILLWTALCIALVVSFHSRFRLHALHSRLTASADMIEILWLQQQQLLLQQEADLVVRALMDIMNRPITEQNVSEVRRLIRYVRGIGERAKLWQKHVQDSGLAPSIPFRDVRQW